MLIVYSKNDCPYCTKAKDYLDIKMIDYEERNISNDLEAKNFIVSQGHSTVPQIYKGDTLFVEGGCDGLLRLSEDELFNRLEA